MNKSLAVGVIVLLSAVPTNVHGAEPAPGKQVEQKATFESGEMDYLLYLPAEYDASEDKKWPLVLFLHGRGESYGPLSLVAKWGPPRFAAKGEDWPFILVSPQCPGDARWSDDTRQEQLDKLLLQIGNDYEVDKKKVYLTGLSMGGYGSWTLSANHPDRFAAVVPICGSGNPDDADKLKSIPIWVFHGDQDSAVPFSRSVEMVEAIRAAGSETIMFTSMEHVGHNCWSSAYAMPQLYDWMLKQKLN